jgi:pSer/pThr/pTyr-binding forkhead associated (FHA) protein
VASIRDLGSTNGTFVNGERITSQHLADGDRVNVGRTTLVYRAGRR